MQNLDEYDSAILLITKGWKHKNIPKVENETTVEYAKKVFADHIGVGVQHEDSLSLWLDFVEEFCTKREIVEVMRRFTKREDTLEEVVIGTVMCLPVKNRFELDRSLIEERGE